MLLNGEIDSGSLEIILRSPEYVRPECCLACVYFQKTKGHFGQCKGALNVGLNSPKIFDGSKKGTSCSLYRTNIELPVNTQITRFEKNKQQRLIFNEKRRKRFIAIRHAGNKHYKRHGLNGAKQFVHDMPYQLTSDIHRKSGYFMHKHNYHVINYALELMKKGSKTKDIINKIDEIYKVKVSPTAIYQWGEKFLGIKHKKYKVEINTLLFKFFWDRLESKIIYELPKFSSNIMNPKCPKCSCLEVVKHGIRKNMSCFVQRYRCKSCKNEFTLRGKFSRSKTNEEVVRTSLKLFSKGLTAHQIKKQLEIQFGIKTSHNSIINWIRKFIPNAKFHTNGSYRNEVREAIRQGIKKRNTQLKTFEREVIAC